MALDIETTLRAAGLDRYDLSARLRPVLFVLIPVFVVLGVWIPQARTLTGVIVALATTCGVTYFLVRLARSRGYALERRLGDRIGRLHSARLLMLQDATFSRETKKRYHSFLAKKGRTLSTLEEEVADPQTAFDRTRSAVDWLLVFTRPTAKQTLLFEDNIAYGYMRNLRGLKSIAIAVDVSAMCVNGTLIVMRWSDGSAQLTGGLVGAALIIILLLWTFLVTDNGVEQASLAYARRLFEQCEAPTPVSGARSRATV